MNRLVPKKKYCAIFCDSLLFQAEWKEVKYLDGFNNEEKKTPEKIGDDMLFYKSNHIFYGGETSLFFDRITSSVNFITPNFNLFRNAK